MSARDRVLRLRRPRRIVDPHRRMCCYIIYSQCIQRPILTQTHTHTVIIGIEYATIMYYFYAVKSKVKQNKTKHIDTHAHQHTRRLRDWFSLSYNTHVHPGPVRIQCEWVSISYIMYRHFYNLHLPIQLLCVLSVAWDRSNRTVAWHNRTRLRHSTATLKPIAFQMVHNFPVWFCSFGSLTSIE